MFLVVYKTEVSVYQKSESVGLRNNFYFFYYILIQLFSYNPTGRVIYLKSFSKIFLPGLRLGVTVLPQSLMPTFLEYKFCRDFSTPLFSQEILATFIENGMFEKHLKSLKDIYALKMHQAKKAVKNIYQQMSPIRFLILVFIFHCNYLKMFIPKS